MKLFGKQSVCKLTEDELDQKVQAIIGKMSLKEKVQLLNGTWDLVGNSLKYKNPYNPTPIKTSGNKKFGIPFLAFSDGPRGVVMGTSTAFPVSMARGAAFDPELEYAIGEAIGREIRAQGANYFGGVCINLLRHPAWGRAQETYSEDPFLVGKMGASLVRGVQHHNVIACAKHYAVNNIENSRFFVDVQADERTLQEVYLPHFRECIDAGAASVMGAYNKFRGDHLCESKYLLNDVLRDQWGFEGFTISDFVFGIRDTKKAIEAGLDVEMPMPIKYAKELLKAIQAGQVSEAILDKSVQRFIRTMLIFTHSSDPQEYPRSVVCQQSHIELARKAAEQSMVLVKNENQTLPLSSTLKKVLVIGDLATKENTGDHGSSRVYAPYVVTPLEGIQKYLNGKADVIYLTDDQITEAKEIAPNVDAVIFVVGNDFNDEGEYVVSQNIEGENPLLVGSRNQGNILKYLLIKSMVKKLEHSYTSDDGKPVGGDRTSLNLKQKQIKAIQEIAPLNPRSIVSLVSGSTIMVEEWHEHVSAILFSWYSGMEGGNALSRLLFGDISPSGKLPFSVPRSEDHLPYFSSTDPIINYDLYHGYTLLDKQNIEPRYPFGFGLSYTTFSSSVSDITYSEVEEKVSIQVEVSNIGAYEGAEVIQAYVGMKDSSIERQKKLLKGFAKVQLQPGETKKIEIPLYKKDLLYFESASKKWKMEPGTYNLWIGTSSHLNDLEEKEFSFKNGDK